LGSQLAAWRAAAGETQRSLSVKLPYSRSTIANVEVGRQTAPRDFWQRCDEVLGAAGDLLASYDELVSDIRRKAAARARMLSGTAASGQDITAGKQSSRLGSTEGTSTGTMEGAAGVGDTGSSGAVRRSKFLTLAGTTVAGVLAPPLVHSWGSHSLAETPSLTEDLLTALNAQADGFRWRDRQEGSRRLLPAAARYAHDVAHLWRLSDNDHPLRQELGRIAADACHLVAYQAFDQGNRAQAIEWYRSSAELAGQNNAPDLYVFAICGVAYMHAGNGYGELALSMLGQLLDLPLSMAARCYIAVYQAHAYAATGERDAAYAALDHAWGCAERTADEAPSPWLGVTDASFVDRQRAMVLVSFADPAALGALELLGRQTPEVFRRYQVTLRADLALAHAQFGDAEQAVAMLTEATKRNATIQSVEKARRLHDVRRVLARHGATTAVRTVDEALRESAAVFTVSPVHLPAKR